MYIIIELYEKSIRQISLPAFHLNRNVSSFLGAEYCIITNHRSVAFTAESHARHKRPRSRAENV